eukprot:TRINITY_DN10525_c0_g1_i1.p1 TRINITY_DN10525_c0_g1~~TRINITY_DN10525_c0_g1_i1.p1  ORF type:complete len:545 (+),score=221.91 TRINITY_DN10525_c0_g1_i1:68-1702(+)
MGEPKATGAEELLRVLTANDVDVCFANPGTTEMNVVEALDKTPACQGVLVLHENTATGAADGYGRMAGKAACTLLHLGVGLSNGIANLHNARRAGAPIVNIIGDMATWHVNNDPLLNMDIAALAHTVSKAVVSPGTADDVGAATQRLLDEVKNPAAVPGGSRVATLVLPHDSARDRIAKPTPRPAAAPAVALAPGETLFERTLRVDRSLGDDSLSQAVGAALGALKTGGKTVGLFLGGEALLKEHLPVAGEIASRTSAALLCENAFPRIDRGGSLPAVTRLPYFPADAKKEFAKYKTLVFLGARIPVAMFGYEDGIDHLVNDNQQIIQINTHDVPGALKYMAASLPLASSVSRPKPSRLPATPKGVLNAAKMCACVAISQPPNAVVVDESLTSGTNYWSASEACPSFSHLTLTGGAIGAGPPMALGAAVACPERRVINLQADGSALYSTQALWSQAREKLKVTTVICNNSVYQILKIEQQKQGLSQTGDAAKSLTSLREPHIDWVSLAKGYGVPAVRVTTCEDLLQQLGTALAHDGPYLIECMI